MSKRKAIPSTIDTAYFNNVSPLWVAPNSTPIESQYHDAIAILATWAGPNWSNNDATNFFPLRNHLINECERWRHHNWDIDTSTMKAIRDDLRMRPILSKSGSMFLNLFRSTALINDKTTFLTSLGFGLSSSLDPDLTIEGAISAFDQSLADFVRRLNEPRFPPIRFGPLWYRGVPRKLPSRSIAISLSVANLVTLWRRDGQQQGSLVFPQEPNLSRNLPWGAIASFASANFTSEEDLIDPAAVQTLVQNLKKRVWMVGPSKPINKRLSEIRVLR